ncbi:UDP-N-acetylenolpyruvoylglucosamine reductase [Leuconostoc gelidum subsp. gasicomitatum]|uniref:UDP-N-acetylenolpyruvoylglucosamine reductase n=1 Tax=Leuconostoc gasicomitatum TaxID=115778 RepID=A0ABP2B5Z9_9LACO|nr:UDP-N-acetylmuramate dehydrogenase [Leuconostoc gasicomitatum]CUW09786.1 UDP-N-acetylenolpyruvoylglucosamine reductase [Leuconostoc gasicomitatum]
MKLNDITILENQPLAPYAHTQVGGKVDYLAMPKTHLELQQLLNWAKSQEQPVHIFGRLSNLVVRDGGLRGLSILLHDLRDIKIDQHTITADAGADLILVTETAMTHGLAGLEWAAGIPGSVGGAVFMNAGAYGGQTEMVVTTVTAIMPDLKIQTFNLNELEFGYRHSVFQKNGGVIVNVTFTLTPDVKSDIQLRMDVNNYRRADKQPLNYPSNGSVFKRPEGYFAGKLIMDSDLQGARIGGVEVSKKHAGFMVNIDNGTGNDYEDLIHHVQATVKKKFNVTLETEVRIIGER